MKYLVTVLLTLITSQAFAQVPTIPTAPTGTLFTCAEAEDDFGCYGLVLNTNGQSVRFGKVRRKVRRELRKTRRQRRFARRLGDIERAAQLSEDLRTLKSVRSTARQCLNYDDPFCEGSGGGGESGGGESGGGSSGGGGSNNSNVSEACDALGDNSSSDELFMRIVNGAVCTQGNSPIVPILNNGSAHCTGSVIAANIVVTAAHCVEDVSCGSLSVTSGSGLSRTASSCPSHPSYDGYSEDNDVALLILDGNLDTRTISLYTTNDFQVGEQVSFAGYGRNEDDDDNLRATFNNLSSITDGSLVVEYSQGQENIGNSCNGDSGGPLAIVRNNEWVLIGAVSNGDAQNCALPGNEQSDVSRWANLTSSSNLQFIRDNTSGIID